MACNPCCPPANNCCDSVSRTQIVSASPVLVATASGPDNASYTMSLNFCNMNAADAECIRNAIGHVPLSNIPYDINMPSAQSSTANAELVRFNVVRLFTLPNNFVGSLATITTPPAATTAYRIYSNTVHIGNITINTSGVATFSSVVPGPYSFPLGTVLSVRNGPTVDPAAGALTVTFRGLLV